MAQGCSLSTFPILAECCIFMTFRIETNFLCAITQGKLHTCNLGQTQFICKQIDRTSKHCHITQHTFIPSCTLPFMNTSLGPGLLKHLEWFEHDTIPQNTKYLFSSTGGPFAPAVRQKAYMLGNVGFLYPTYTYYTKRTGWIITLLEHYSFLPYSVQVC